MSMNKHEAIYKLNPSVVTIRGDIAYDENGNVVSYDESAVTADANITELRQERDRKLAETDWTQSRDVTLTNDAAWQTYRQALRDITDTYSDLDSVVWPTKPE